MLKLRFFKTVLYSIGKVYGDTDPISY